MVPRGEVGLIFAQMGLASGAIGADLFGAIMLMVLVTTLVTPPLLGRLAAGQPRGVVIDRPGEGGIDDLVVGTRRSRVRRDSGVEGVAVGEVVAPDLEDASADALSPSERAALRAQQRIEARLAKLAQERATRVDDPPA